jgi:threonine/homoserine efflux transporter RhtA
MIAKKKLDALWILTVIGCVLVVCTTIAVSEHETIGRIAATVASLLWFGTFGLWFSHAQRQYEAMERTRSMSEETVRENSGNIT